ncbi:MAG TPA: hypothetical protein ENN68_04335 [Methanomicrobia archaeon]|nr:hypothetical protein [Methanomicrobia archaeon]
MKNVLFVALLALGLALGTVIVGADAGEIEPIDDFSGMDWDYCADFEDVTGGGWPGTNYDEILCSGDLQLAERFLGQTLLLPHKGFDELSGTPFDPLALQTGDQYKSLCVYNSSLTHSNAVAGLGPNIGWPNAGDIGEGSVAVLFPSPQSRFKFDIVGKGSVTIQFFRADGSLLDTCNIPTTDQKTYGFRCTSENPEIRGFSIHNIAPGGGLLYDNICSAADTVDQMITVTKDYRYADVCFEQDNDGDGLFDEDDVDCPAGTYGGDALPMDDEDNYLLEAVVSKDDKVRSYNPGQYYAVSTVTVLADVATLTIEDVFWDCADADISTLIPSQGGGSVVIVQIGPDDPAEVAYQILDAQSAAVTVDLENGTAKVELTEVKAGTTIRMYVKFGPALRGELWAGPISCASTMTARATTGGGDSGETASATAALKLIIKA